jgi:hypothetical protein
LRTADHIPTTPSENPLKRLVLACCALLLLCAITTYHAVPLLYKEPLLWLNRSLSGLEEKTVQAAGHRIHTWRAVQAARVARRSCYCTASSPKVTTGWTSPAR